MTPLRPSGEFITKILLPGKLFYKASYSIHCLLFLTLVVVLSPSRPRLYYCYLFQMSHSELQQLASLAISRRSSNAQASGPRSGTQQAISLARGSIDPNVNEPFPSRRVRNQGHLTLPTHLDYSQLRSRGIGYRFQMPLNHPHAFPQLME